MPCADRKAAASPTKMLVEELKPARGQLTGDRRDPTWGRDAVSVPRLPKSYLGTAVDTVHTPGRTSQPVPGAWCRRRHLTT